MSGDLLLVSYLLIINFIAFLIMGLDKSKSRNGSWRIPEIRLMTLALIGGSLGLMLGMNVFRHKTQKIKFKWGIPFIIIIQVVIAYYLLYK